MVLGPTTYFLKQNIVIYLVTNLRGVAIRVVIFVVQIYLKLTWIFGKPETFCWCVFVLTKYCENYNYAVTPSQSHSLLGARSRFFINKNVDKKNAVMESAVLAFVN